MPLLIACNPAVAPLTPAPTQRNEPVSASETSDDSRANMGVGELEPESNASPSGHFESLSASGQPEALVWVPPHSPERLPLLVIAHGAGGTPDWHCEFWREVVQDGAFLLCLRGHPLSRGMDAFYFPEHHTLERIFRASVAAFDEQFAERVRTDRSIFIGYSQGATMGSLMLTSHAARFSRALFIEGGYGTWNVARAKHLQSAGGEAVFIACGTASCDNKASNAVRWLARAGLHASSETAHGEGHTPGGEVGLLAIEGLGWLLRQ